VRVFKDTNSFRRPAIGGGEIREQERTAVMDHQEKVGTARILGYAIGAAVFIAVAVWKLIVR
jgi:hypothetical protein